MYIFKIKKHKTRKTAGFSLIELIVSLSVFSIVMMVSIGTLLTLIDVNAKAQALSSATTNLSFALDSITREVRMGYHYYCDTQIPDEGQSLPNSDTVQDCTQGKFVAFTREKTSERIGYRLNGTVIEQKLEGESWTPITSPDVVVDIFDLTVEGTEPFYPAESDQIQPTIDIMVKGHVNNGLDTDTSFNIQTHIIQRRLDIL